MTTKEDEFLQKLVTAFREEAADHLNVIINGLLELEQEKTDKDHPEILEQIYRSTHSLKGAARAVNFQDVETVCQSFESVLAAIKTGAITPSVSHFDTLQQTIDLLQGLLDAPEKVADQQISTMKNDLKSLLEQQGPHQATQAPFACGDEEDTQPSPANKPASDTSDADKQPKPATLTEHQQEETAPPLQAAPLENAPPSTTRPSPIIAERIPGGGEETIRIATTKLGLLFRQAEEMMAIKLYTRQRLSDIKTILADLEYQENRTMKLSSAIQRTQLSLAQTFGSEDGRQNRSLIEQINGYLKDMHDGRKKVTNKIGSLVREVKSDERLFQRMVDEHLEEVKKALMLPFSNLLAILPKMARDLARAQDKAIHLETSGGEVEIDRRILEVLKDPLIHLVRNCIDHGVESPNVRVRKGKPPQAHIKIAVSRCESNRIEVEITDDGNGIDHDRVVHAAIKAGYFHENEIDSLTEQEKLDAIFHSGITTSTLITDISGRGLGLAIVREKVENIGGAVSLTTKKKQGTVFKLELPTMMATFRGVFVRVAGHIFSIPSIHVQQVFRIATESIRSVENRDTVILNDEVVSLVWLADCLQLPRAKETSKKKRLQLLDLCIGKTRSAFVVDEIIQEDEGLVKNLGKLLVDVPNISGVTVMGSGELVPIIDVPDLLATVGRSYGETTNTDSTTDDDEPDKKSILVVEDSVTSRILLKNVLESAGYEVVTAIDGMAGWTELKTKIFQAVVSDIEMPRMNGFELTAKIRGDQRLNDLPVVLVTGLDAKEHRERGIEVGANGYIVKSSFDQNNLLDVIGRLI